MLSRRIAANNNDTDADPSDITELPRSSPLLFVFSGPSGVGKDSIVEQLKKHDPNRRYAVTATTRDPRQGEVDGVHYHFKTKPEFEMMLNNQELLESARVYDNWYGLPKSELNVARAAGQDLVVKVDVQGSASIKNIIPQAILIFVAPYHINELAQRQFSRHAVQGWDLIQRKEAAKAELAASESFDYLVINKQGDLAKTVAQVEAIILAEKSRRHPAIFAV